MNKREVVWLIIRLIGVYFAYTAVVTVFALASSLFAFYNLSADSASTVKPDTENVKNVPGMPNMRPETPEVKPAVKGDPAIEKQKSDAFKSILLYFLLTGIYGGLAFYLIAKGNRFYRILAKEAAAPRQEEDKVTTLRL